MCCDVCPTASVDNARTSSFAAWSKIFAETQPRMQAIEEKAHRLLRIPEKTRAEGLQVINYKPGQR